MAGIKLEVTDLPEFSDSLEITITIKKDGTIIQKVVPNPSDSHKLEPIPVMPSIPSHQSPVIIPNPSIPSYPSNPPGYVGDPPPGSVPTITCESNSAATSVNNQPIAGMVMGNF